MSVLKALFGRYHEYMPLWNDGEGKPIRRRKAVLGVLGVLGVSLVVILVASLLLWGDGGRRPRVQGGMVREEDGGWIKPAGLSVVALVFYGRRANVQILERYLRVRPPQNPFSRSPVLITCHANAIALFPFCLDFCSLGL
jgi:hypothetical protein